MEICKTFELIESILKVQIYFRTGFQCHHEKFVASIVCVVRKSYSQLYLILLPIFKYHILPLIDLSLKNILSRSSVTSVLF